jgi:hypothetical protein
VLTSVHPIGRLMVSVCPVLVMFPLVAWLKYYPPAGLCTRFLIFKMGP